jgi:Bacterial shufflon protein, N-terminal constant region
MKKSLLLFSSLVLFILNSFQAIGQNIFPATGNVGIGTIAPSQKLQVTGGNILTDGAVYSSDWFRSYGNSGWYNENYGGGWHMADPTWIRSYGSKNIYCDQTIRADAGFQVDGQQVIDADGSWHRSYGAAGWYNNTYGGGWYMADATWIRSYGSKNIYCDKTIRADAGFDVGGRTLINANGSWSGAFFVDGQQVIDAGAGWHRTYGSTGWYNGTYGGGFYMADDTWIRTYNNKAFYSSNTMRTDGELQAGPNGDRLLVDGVGKVKIGNVSVAPVGYKLFVEQGILTEKVKVAIKTTSNWADHVFASNYSLMPLKEVENFIKTNKHLPNIPSAKEMVEEGLDVATMNAKLLEKIEELTLHVIKQEKDIENLNSVIKKLLPVENR